MRTVRRRRLESKTDYKARLALLKSDKARLVIRKTNRYLIVQFVETDLAQDKVLIGASSSMLLAKGWPKDHSGSLKSLTAAYLTGLLLGNMAKKNVKEAVLDMGMNRNVHKSRIYAVLKGVIDAGIDIPHNKEVVPSLDEIKRNKNLVEIFNKVKV
jgi:large subunit ribosomal protein L18